MHYVYAPELHFGRTSVALLPRKRIEGLAAFDAVSLQLRQLAEIYNRSLVLLS